MSAASDKNTRYTTLVLSGVAMATGICTVHAIRRSRWKCLRVILEQVLVQPQQPPLGLQVGDGRGVLLLPLATRALGRRDVGIPALVVLEPRVRGEGQCATLGDLNLGHGGHAFRPSAARHSLRSLPSPWAPGSGLPWATGGSPVWSASRPGGCRLESWSPAPGSQQCSSVGSSVSAAYSQYQG